MPPKPPPKQITSLSQIDIAKMDINDLKHINYQKLVQSIRQKPDVAISIIAPLAAIFVCFSIFTKSAKERTDLQNKNVQMQEKLEIVTEYHEKQNELKTFMTALPEKLSENDFFNTITDFAAKNNIQIDSFSPAQNKSDPIYNLTIINLTANAKNFNDVGRFVRDIETSNKNIRITEWSANMGAAQGNSRRGRNQSDDGELFINFQLKINLVTFKE